MTTIANTLQDRTVSRALPMSGNDGNEYVGACSVFYWGLSAKIGGIR
ncbi:hypothetical protein [uncultured Jannaschia sp.]|nr:hypothetical protein [uncultured Jannaschia sp.]